MNQNILTRINFKMRLLSWIVFHLINMSSLNAQKQNDGHFEYPTPPSNKNMLFYLQRNINENTIVYELNYNGDSSINGYEPIKVYWIQYSEKGQRQPLSAMQKKYSYGITSSLVDKEKSSFKINLIGYPTKDIYVLKSGNGSYGAYISVNSKTIRIERIFFKIDGGSFISPNVVYIEISGKDIKTNQQVSERFEP